MKEFAVWIERVSAKGRLPFCVRWREPKGATGEKRKKPKKSFATEKEAERFKQELLDAAKAAVANPSTEPEPQKATPGTVADFLNTWLDVHIKDIREAATYRSYEGIVRLHLIPGKFKDGRVLGELPITACKSTLIEQFLNDKYAEGMPYAKRKHLHSCLSSAMTRAVIDGHLTVNPCQKLGLTIRRKHEQSEDPTPNPFSRVDATRFLAYVEEHERAWFEYFTFLHDTGVRVGEAAALKWVGDDGLHYVDLKTGRAFIAFSYSPSDNKDKDTKTHQRRWIDLSDLVVEQLTAWRKRQRVELLKCGRSTVPYVFTLSNGSPRRQDGNMRRVFDRVVRNLRIGYVQTKRGEWIRDPNQEPYTPHSLRDTFASTHLEEDWDRKLAWVSGQLGHQNPSTTEDHYFALKKSATSRRQFANEIR